MEGPGNFNGHAARIEMSGQHELNGVDGLTDEQIIDRLAANEERLIRLRDEIANDATKGAWRS